VSSLPAAEGERAVKKVKHASKPTTLIPPTIH